MHKPTLYLMLGLPGAGKTTTAETIAELTGAVHLASDRTRMEIFSEPSFSPDEHMQLYQELDTRVEKLLSDGKDVIYDANLNRKIHRKEKYEICKRTDAKPLLLWVQTPKDLAKSRAVHESRKHLWPKEETPHDMFERIASVIEVPGSDEPFTSIDGTKVNETYIRHILDGIK